MHKQVSVCIVSKFSRAPHWNFRPEIPLPSENENLADLGKNLCVETKSVHHLAGTILVCISLPMGCIEMEEVFTCAQVRVLGYGAS